MHTLGERLEHVLKYFNTTKKDFALSIKYSPGNVTDWIKGRYKPSSRALINIENTYGISQKWLIDGVGNMFVKIPEGIIIDVKLTNLEINLIKTYRRLNEKDKRKVVIFIENLTKSPNYEENPT
ncbi:helix-turn-helix domain-containing protein [Clostridium sp. LBM24168]